MKHCMIVIGNDHPVVVGRWINGGVGVAGTWQKIAETFSVVLAHRVKHLTCTGALEYQRGREAEKQRKGVST